MKNKLIDHFLTYTKLTKDEIDAINESMDIKEYKKDSFLQREDDINQNSYFVMSGLVREYKLIKDEEISTNFYTEGQWILLFSDTSENQDFKVNLYCLEDTFFVVGNEDKAQKLFKDYPRLESVARMIIEDYMVENQKQIRTYLFNTPEERYLKLLNQRPELFERVSQVNLSSYIGVKPESLSRIRKRLYNKKD
ncbi:MAG: Crp/Fnr family transcriptional regulator [Spirochaetaceae bacterium]